ncbi:MAG: hypothetical protein LAP87_10985 [Acidobacteriia bacterium]|nr:hypothetical protein [Terriglobia bacterium]
MFDSLTDRIREDELKQIHGPERFLRLAAVVVVSFLLFGGLYLVVLHLE